MAGQSNCKKLLSTTAIAAAGLMIISGIARADDNAWVLDQAGGSFSTDTSVTSSTTITQNSDRAIGVGNLDIQAHQRVNIVQKDSGSLFVAKDNRSDPTHILGKLSANGRVMVLDENGIFFGSDSVIDVGGIVASTGDVDNDAVMRGDNALTLRNFGDGPVINNGHISASGAGLSAFVAPHVANNGIIEAKLGKVALASGGESATIDLYGDGLVEIAVGGAKGKALAENNGSIDGATVLMTAEAAKNVVDTVINMTGVIKATSATQQGGKIILSGGNGGIVHVSGDIAASGETGGGHVSITGQNVEVTADSTIVANAGEHGNGGTAFIYGDDYAVFSGNLFARGGTASGDGGNAEISGGEGVGYYGYTDMSAANGETGTLLIDPRHLNISTGGTGGNLAYVLSLGLLGTFNVNDQALADTLRSTNVNLWASETLNTTTDIDISTWEQKNYSFSFPFCIFGCYTGSTYGIASHDLTIAAPEINLTNDIILGTGSLNVYNLAAGTSVLGFGIIKVPAGGINVDVVNLDGTIYRRGTVGVGNETVAGDSQINSQAHTVNVQSNAAKIQQGIYLADDNGTGTVNVAAGTYQEQIEIAKNVDLIGVGKDTTTIQSPTALAQTGFSPGLARNYSIVYAHDASDVDISGFTIDGTANTQLTFDNGRRFIGVLYRNAGGDLTDNRVTGIVSDPTVNRSGFAILASANNIPAATLNIRDNVVDDFQKFGIAFVDGNLQGEITGNQITGDPGIATDQVGILVGWNARALVDNNTVDAADIGVEVFEASDNTVSNNILTGNGTGIHIENDDNTALLSNVISNSGARGLYVSGQNNGSVILKGNNFTGNTIGAEFESGMIDMTGLGADQNSFDGGTTGLRFDPTIAGDPSKLALADDDGPGGYGGTIGETVFSNLPAYIELANGAFFAPGNPTLLNGAAATYDGFRPDTVALMSPTQYQALEDGIFHFPDAGTLGRFYFGVAGTEEEAALEQERMLNSFAGFSGPSGRFSMTIMGLPNVPGGGNNAGNGGGNTAEFFANITPAAGGNGTDNGGEQASDQSTQNVAGLEPAAGGGTQEAACWSEAAAQASAGSPVSYSFGSSMEEALSQAASCASGTAF
jgi:filamentous hemagglutinin family protein